MDALIELFAGHTTKITFKTSKVTITMRTLTTDEIADVLRRVDLLAVTDVTKAIISRKLTLAYSIEAINGVDVLSIPEVQDLKKSKGDESLTKVDLLSEILGKFDDVAIRNLYDCYDELSTEHEKSVEALKKDSKAQ